MAFAFVPRGATDPEAILFFDCVDGPVFFKEGGDGPQQSKDGFLEKVFDQKNMFKKLKQFIGSYYHEIKKIEVNISIYE